MRLFGKKRISIQDLSVDLADWQELERAENALLYGNAYGDFFSINFFDVTPDIGASLQDVDGIRDYYRQLLISSHGGLLQCDVETVAGLPMVYLLAKFPMDPTGFAFLGSYTLPSRDHSFVLKYQAQEHGLTGSREAAVMAMLPNLEIDEHTQSILGWCADPYDDTLNYQVMRNLADSEEYDSTFKEHPLSRARQFMGQLPQRMTLSKTLRNAPPFTPS